MPVHRPVTDAKEPPRAMPENRLAEESSPYLLQHKDNPVQWYPWGAEALEAAKTSNRPILLSIGYAACHWCHVMAHETFENETIAGVMNELFVNIKVDREERPDLDSIYQSALALLGEHGGWPLTMFLTPQGEPFWGGTYFPPEPRYGRPGFPQVLRSIATSYAKQPENVTRNATILRDALGKLSQNRNGEHIRLAFNDQVAERLLEEIDPVNGGIGGAPKFPQPAILKLLWRAWTRTKTEPYRNAVELTMTRMCQGGIYDHLGGGFARYAVDNRWLVPHFEKMLYDNAQLIELLTWLWQETRNPLFQTRLRETVAWTLREMIADADGSGQVPSGAFASSLDADSEGEEGKFYLWSATEVEALLGPMADDFKAAYDVTPGGNWEGKTILNRLQRPELGDGAQEDRLAKARDVLFVARSTRVRPGWDDKVLADWNGLMIAALAKAAPVFREPAWLEAAETAFRFVVEHMTEGGRLKHAWRHGRLRHPATLDDYANLYEAALALYETTGLHDYLAQAEAWTQVLDAYYWDPEGGGYFLTADDTERLIVRTKNAYDSAVPSGNGVMTSVLVRLYYLTGQTTRRDQAETLIKAFAGELQRNFFPLATLLNGSELLHSGVQVVVAGDRDSEDCQTLLSTVYGKSLPDCLLHFVGSGANLPAGHPAHGKHQVDGKATAYVCRGLACSLPITDPAELARALAA
jgi:uncharacterized protein YyaL (SSP411 family)